MDAESTHKDVKHVFRFHFILPFRKPEKLQLPTSVRIMLYYTIFEDKFWPQRWRDKYIKQLSLYSIRILTNSLAYNDISVIE